MSFNGSIPYTVNSGDTHVMLTRSAMYPLWGDRTITTPAVHGACYQLANIEGIAFTAQNNICNVGVVDCCGAFWGDTHSGVGWPAFSGPVNEDVLKKPILGVDSKLGDVPFVYFPAGSTLLYTVSNFGAGAESTMTLEAWVGPGDKQSTNYVLSCSTNGASSMGGSISISSNSWLRVHSVTLEIAALNVSTTPTCSIGCALTTDNIAPTYTRGTGANAGGTWTFASGSTGSRAFLLPLHFNPEYDNSLVPFRNTRLNAVAALFTNTTKVLNKEGTALWGRVPPTRINPWRVSKTDIEQLHPAEKCFMGLEQGCYAYNPPSTDLADFYNLTFRSYYSNNEQTENNQPLYRLDSDAMVAHCYFSDPDGGTSLAINLDYHIEFRTSSTLFQIGVSNHTIEALHQAQVGLLKAGFFFSNWDHTEIIRKIVAGVASLHPLLSVAAPLAHGLLQSSTIASRKSTKPRPTTAQRSGITLPPRTQQKRNARKKKKSVTVSRSKSTVSKALSAMDRIMARQGRPARGA